jgi:hypothetical protein
MHATLAIAPPGEEAPVAPPQPTTGALDVARVVDEALRRAGLDDGRPVGLRSVWRDAGLREAVARWAP